MNMIVNNIDDGVVVASDGVYKDEVLTLGAADTLLAGTILARSDSTGKLVIFVKGGIVDGNGTPKVVLPYEVTVTGAGDVPIRALHAGKVRFDKLVIDADGDNSNIDATVMDQLRDYGIDTLDIVERNILDNQ